MDSTAISLNDVFRRPLADGAQVPVWYPQLRQQLAGASGTGPGNVQRTAGIRGDGASETRARDLLGAIQPSTTHRNR